jgi:hypothetical protein
MRDWEILLRGISPVLAILRVSVEHISGNFDSLGDSSRYGGKSYDDPFDTPEKFVRYEERSFDSFGARTKTEFG